LQKTRPPEGCAKATYPDSGWQSVPCTEAPTEPYLPTIVGNTVDYAASVAGTMNSATGTFSDGVDGVTSEAGYVGGNPPLVANSYSLQLNTQTFPTAACKAITNCLGWQQFVYSAKGQVFMQYWLLGWGPKCPKFWKQPKQYPNDCYISSTAAPAPAEPISALATLSLTGLASPGTDAVILSTETGVYAASFNDSALGLAGKWQQAEFNIFGQCCSTQANFNAGVTLHVRVGVVDGTTNAPGCPSNGYTGETNSLTLLPPCTALFGAGGVPPTILFAESNILAPVVLAITPTTGPVTGGTIVITGVNFYDVHAVSIGNVPASGFTVTSTTSILAIVPAFAGGEISVTTPLGTAIGPAYNPFPIITSISPGSGPIRGGTPVVVSGKGLPNSWTYPFSFGGTAVTASCGEVANQCGMVAPPAPLLQAGAVDITVDGSPPVAADKFTYTGPIITGLSPNTGSAYGDTPVLVEGNGFASNMTVTFGYAQGSPVDTTCQLGTVVATPGSDSCSFFAPPGTGPVHVVANVNGALSTPTNADLFTYVEPPTGALSPDTGPMTGGTPVTLTGTNFSTAPGTTIVLFTDAGVGAQVTASCATTTTCQLTTPEFGEPGNAFLAKVYVKANGIAAAVPSGFTFTPVAGKTFIPGGGTGDNTCPRKPCQ
jgi:hypothetical protein